MQPDHPADRAPELTPRFVGVVAAIMLLALAGSEVAARSAGITPSLTDGVSLWSLQRDGIGPQTTVIVGSSRMQLGIDPTHFGAEVANLSLLGDSPIPVLEHLAEDPAVSGTVVVGFMPLRFCTMDRNGTIRANDFINRYERSPVIGPLEAQLRIAVQSRSSLLNSSIRPVDLLTGHQTLRDVRQQIIRADRFAPRDYSHTDVGSIIRLREQLWSEQLQAPFPPAKYERRINRVARAVDRIMDRGGHVTFFRINSSGRAHELEQRYASRSQCYDRWAEQIPRARWLHFADLPTITDLELPEGSHADSDQAQLVTKALVSALSGPANIVE